MDESKQITAVNVKDMTTARDWNTLTDAFVNSYTTAESTRKLYKRTLRQFFKWVENVRGSSSSLTRLDIVAYNDYLFSVGLAPLTINSYLTSLKKFYSWLHEEAGVKDIAKGVKVPEKAQRYEKNPLTATQSKELLDDIKNKNTLRDFAIVNLLLRSGLRTVEVMRADVGDIVEESGRTILYVWGKGRKDKKDFVILSPKAVEPIKAYLRTRGTVRRNEPLFVNNSHNNQRRGRVQEKDERRLSTRSISKICKDGLVNIGLNSHEYSAHSLRHTVGCALLEQTDDISAVQSVLRHRSQATTQLYVKQVQRSRRIKNATELLLDEVF